MMLVRHFTCSVVNLKEQYDDAQRLEGIEVPVRRLMPLLLPHYG